jgi:hypothetical protein
MSVDDASQTLRSYHTTVWPIAVETAEWLYRNWSLKEFCKFSESDRNLLIDIIDKEIIRKQSDASENIPDLVNSEHHQSRD